MIEPQPNPDEIIRNSAAVTDEREALRRKHDESLAALQESEQRYRSLVLAISQIVWTTDATGEVEDIPTWRAYTGQTPSEVKGWGWLDALHPEDRAPTAQNWIKSVRSKNIYETEYRIRGKDGSYRYFWARGVPVIAEDGQIREWVGICTDITEHKQAEAALKARAEELTYLTTVLARTNFTLEKRNQELDQFVYVASHDLKAPLRAISNLSQWIEEDLGDRLTGETRHQMNLLRGRVQRMEALIDGLLAYSRSGRVNTEVTKVSVATLLEEVIDSLDPPPTFKIEFAPNMPQLLTERLPLVQLFTNLISNAIKHHPRQDGKVKIAFAEQRDFYQFSVTDDGAGIAPEYHEKVFGIFQTLEPRDKTENTGIGLAIVKKIVESRGGHVWLESASGEGATFYFTWPK